MTNGFYTMNEYVDNSNAAGSKRFSDSEFVKELMNGVTSKASMIDAIEAYNTDHKLNEKERIKYSVGLGEMYVSVLKAYKLGNNNTYAIIGRDYSGYGLLNKSNDPNKSNTMEPSISTHVVDITDISDVWISGYDKTAVGTLFEDKGVDEISTKELESILTNLKKELNCIHSTGEYRLFFGKFNYEMKKNNLNELSYEHRSTAYNLYTEIWTKYISVIKDILNNFEEIGYISDEELAKKLETRVPSLIFVNVDTKDDLEEKLQEMYTAKFINSGYTSAEIMNSKITESVNAIILRTFCKEDINTFRAVINQE